MIQLLIRNRLLILVLLCPVVVSCVSYHKDLHDPAELTPKLIKSEESSAIRHAAVYIVGFFNSEKLEIFEPEPINYSPIVNSKRLYSMLQTRLSDRDIRLIPLKDIKILSAESLSQEDWDQFQVSLYNTLVLLRAFVLEHEVPDNFTGLPFPNLVKVQSARWGEDWSAFIIVGLEQLSSVRGGARYLRSALAVVRTTPSGEYVGVHMGTYDFSSFNTAAMSSLVADLIAGLH